MIADIRKHLEIVPFIPFAVRTADGREYPVPAVDHVYLPPGGSRVVIADDEGLTVALPALLISGPVQVRKREIKTQGRLITAGCVPALITSTSR